MWKRWLTCWVRAVLFSFCVPAIFAQVPTTFQYIYDDLNQLAKVIDSTGIVIEYVYDPVGNIVQVKRSATTPGGLTIFSFTPQQAGGCPLVRRK